MQEKEDWESRKRRAYERIFRDREIGYLDPDILPTLEAFFSWPNIFTKSSCSGRITVIDALMPWDRRNSTVMFKDHLGVTTAELEDLISKGALRRLWLVVQGPIVHAYAKDLNSAWELLRVCRSVGFKHSGILTKNANGFLVEVRSGVRMDHALYADRSENSALEKIVEVANEVLGKGKEKLNLLTKALQAYKLEQK
jgi:tRNA wybutosine-synthesizing protein 3